MPYILARAFGALKLTYLCNGLKYKVPVSCRQVSILVKRKQTREKSVDFKQARLTLLFTLLLPEHLSQKWKTHLEFRLKSTERSLNVSIK